PSGSSSSSSRSRSTRPTGAGPTRRRDRPSRCTANPCAGQLFQELAEAADQSVRVRAVVVEVERGPYVPRKASTRVVGVGTVHARADQHLVTLIQEDRGVVRVDAVN